MGYILEQNPELNKPDMIVGWPGIGNVGILTVETLWRQLEAEYLGKIEPEPFFYPNAMLIKDSILENLTFPSSRFYYKRLPDKDYIFFVGEEQPSESGSTYASGMKAYEMANLVIDVATHFGCERVFTAGAAVSPIHHSASSAVWAVASDARLLTEINANRDRRLVSELQGRSVQANVSGLNGLLVGVAASRGIPAACLMGEIPDYLARSPMPYPAAVKPVLEVINTFFGIPLDYSEIDEMRRQMNEVINQFFEQFPEDIQEKLSQRRQIALEKEAGSPITEEDKKWLEDHIEELFQPGEGGNDRPA